MNLIEKATIMHYHRHRIDAYRPGTIKALGWRGTESQIKRFEILTTVGNLNGTSILDVGCGYGDLKAYLDQKFSNVTYIGIDQMPEFIADAKHRYRDHTDIFFTQTDFTVAEFPTVDYVLASGALGYRCENRGFYSAMIRKMYAAATKAIAFNMLDHNQFQDDELLVGHDREQIIACCKTLSANVRVITGYLKDDFTILLYRE